MPRTVGLAPAEADEVPMLQSQLPPRSRSAAKPGPAYSTTTGMSNQQEQEQEQELSVPVPPPAPPLNVLDAAEEYVCYGDRVAFLCEGQLLALTRKFNLTYQQMALLLASTLVSGGLLGVAGFFVWRKGLFRKRYAALFGEDIYASDDALDALDAVAASSDRVPLLGELSTSVTDKRSASRTRSRSTAKPDATTRSQSHCTASGVAGEPVPPIKGSGEEHGSVAFRFFEFDPKKQQLDFSSVGLPVRFGAPLVVVHAETGRAIKYLSHRGAVTISKPPVNLSFHRQVRASLFALEDSSVQLNGLKRPRPQSLTTALFPTDEPASRSHLRATVGAGVAPRREQEDEDEETFPYRDTDVDVDPELELDLTLQNQLDNQRQTQVLTSYPRGQRWTQDPRKLPILAGMSSTQQRRRPQSSSGYPTHRRSLDPANVSEIASPTRRSAFSHGDASGTGQVRVRRRARSSSASALGKQPFYRSISESYTALVSDLSDSLQRQRERHELRKRQRRLMKDLPNMSFNTHAGKYYVATLQPVRHQLSGSNYRLPVAPHDEFLRWGEPMSLVASFNGRGCGIRPREYYKDSDLYLTTEASPTTIVPLREDGDLKCMAKESTRCLAHLEKRQVQLSVGTYNVWMMPRKVSAFTSVSPKKNTRARLIADVLPPCDVWVLTECFDHRARQILLDKMAEAGYFFFSPTVGHKRMNKSNMRKLLNGGVVLASKYPILSVRVKLFEGACAGADKLADKGVLYCKILKDGLLVHVFSTHLQAWNDPLSRSMRKAQMQLIADFVQVMDVDPVNDVVLFTGDLNVNYWLNKTNNEYDEMLEVFEARDPSVVRPSARRGATAASSSPQTAGEFKHARQFSFDPRVNALAAEGLSTDGSLELLDYVLYSRVHRQPREAASWIQPLTTSTPWFWRGQPQYNLSDHFPVVSDFTFDM